MNKRKMKLLPIEQLPHSIEILQFSDSGNYQYVFSARKYIVENKSVLVVTFFSISKKEADFRVFFSKKDFVVEKLLPERKWSNSKLSNLVQGHCITNSENQWVYRFYAVCANKKSTAMINKFFGKEDQLPIEVMDSFQMDVRSAQLKVKHEIINKRTCSLMKQIKTLPKDIMKWADKDILSHYIYYRREKKIIHGYCTSCKSDIDVSNGRHNEAGICPKCNKEITFKAIGISKRIRDTSAFSLIQKTDYGIVVRLFTLHKAYDEDYKNPEMSHSEVERCFFHNGKVTKYAYDYKWNKDYTKKEYSWRESHDNRWIRNYFLYPKNLSDALHETEWQYCCLKEYLQYNPQVEVVKFLTAYSELPILEYFIKLRLYRLAEEIVYRKYITGNAISKALNLDGKNFEEVISVSKEILPFLQKHNVTSLMLRFIQIIYVEYGFFNDEYLEIYNSLKAKNSYDVENFVDRVAKAVKFTTYVKAMNYITKQCKLPTYKSYGIVNALGEWLDYMKHAKLLDYDIKSEFILFPKNLKREHDRMAKEYSEKRAKVNETKINAMVKAINLEFMFESDGYIVRAPNSAKEIKDEGAILKHCVGGYYLDDMAAGVTVILFIRKAEEPDVPFFTLEYKNGVVSQCQGFQHCDMTPDVKKFVNKWLAKKVKAKKVKSA